MTATAGFGYDHVFELATQLSPEERERFVREMDAFRQKPVAENKINWEEAGFVEYVVPGEPLVSATEIEEIKRRANDRQPMNTPEEREKNRQELLEILLNCPVMTDEELKGFEEARREINTCRLAYL